MSIEYISLVKNYAVLAGSLKTVLLEIADRANVDHGDTCWPSIENISVRTGLSRRTVIRRLNWLASEGWISKASQISNHGQSVNKYRLNVQRLRDLQANAAVLKTDFSETQFEPFPEEIEAMNRKKSFKNTGCQNDTPPCQGDTAQGVSECHPNLKEPKNNLRISDFSDFQRKSIREGSTFVLNGKAVLSGSSEMVKLQSDFPNV